MSLQQFDNEDSTRTQRMTADESRAVIALWQQERVEQTGLTDKPAVPDVAEGLGIGVEDVQRLLAEVRAQRMQEERQLVQKQVLSEIYLAEEERKRAEIRRQRAEISRAETKYQYEHEPQTSFVPEQWFPQFQIDQFLCGFLPGFIVLVAGMLIVLLLSAVSTSAPPLP